MAQAIPDLWRAGEDASRLYALYLAHLAMNNDHERIVAVCPAIRRYVSRGPGPKEGLFAFHHEIDAMCHLQDFQRAWRRLRQREEIIHGRRIDIRKRRWRTGEDVWDLEYNYAPLKYFLGQYRQGCQLLETALDLWFTSGHARSYDLLWRVFNGEEEPSHRCRVTLAHLYGRLGRRLNEWRHWEAFVNGLHPRLFRLAGVDREDMWEDPGHLEEFTDKLMQLRRERITSGVGGSLSDLIESETKVKQRQAATKRRLQESRRRHKPVEERTNAKLLEYFPELEGLLD